MTDASGRADPDDRVGLDDPDRLLAEVRVRQGRHRRWRLDGGNSVAGRLGQIGMLGWMVVLPMLGGIMLGRWLDRMFHSGLFCTAPLLLLGAVLGGWMAWRWMLAS